MNLYALCDQDLLDKSSINLEDFIKNAKSNNAKILQYRAKNLDIKTIKDNLIKIRTIFDGFLIINDKYELCKFCDGVHLGQEDLYSIDEDPQKSIKLLKKVIGNDKIIGVSTHNKEEIEITNKLDINYIGLGAYKSTTTKDVPDLLGDTLDDIANSSIHKVAAIGGVKLDDTFQNVEYIVVGSGLL